MQDYNDTSSLLSKNQSSFFATNRLKIFYSTLSLINGALYFAVAAAGGDNVERIFDFHGPTADIMVDVVGGFSSLCYTMFFYKTLESLSIKPKNVLEGGLACLAPLAASSFFTAGLEGAKKLGIQTETALILAILLFILRMVNCVDGSTKFPSRLKEMQEHWNLAWTSKDFKELARLIVTGLVSLGFSAASTDAIYNASMSLLNLFGADQKNYSHFISFAASLLGAVGILPMTLYWTHRGLKQLTFGGKENELGKNPDPTDRYTFFSLPIVLTVTLGIIGSATGTSGKIFGSLGMFANIVRVASSTIYAVAAATPGISTLLRGIFTKCGTQVTPEKLVENLTDTTQNESSGSDQYQF